MKAMRFTLSVTALLMIVGSAHGDEPGQTATNTVGMKLAYIPPGTFTMGSPKTEPGRIANETRQQVTFRKGFQIGVTEVTQKQWRLVMETSPGYFKGDDLPVERITWHEAEAFCRRLSEKEHKRYRLPTEADWEYACRAGAPTAYGTGRDEAALDQVGWYRGNSGNRSHPVGRKAPNRWGLYDMHGNVSEWCAERPDAGTYTSNSAQLAREEKRLRDFRGGSWGLGPGDCRSASRHRNAASYRFFDLGLRVVCEFD